DASCNRSFISRATMKTKPAGFLNSSRRLERIRTRLKGGVVMRRSGLCIHRVSGSSIAWLFAVLLTAGAWVPSAFCQATYSVKEPSAPQASQAVATLLAESERLHQVMRHEEALREADRALAAALEA